MFGTKSKGKKQKAALVAALSGLGIENLSDDMSIEELTDQLQQAQEGGARVSVVQLADESDINLSGDCLLYTSPSPRDQRGSRMPSSA